MKKIHYQENKFALGTILCTLKSGDSNESSAKYLYYYLSVSKNILLFPLMKGITNVALLMGRIAQLKILIPPLEHQNRIIDLLTLCDALKDKFSKDGSLSAQLLRALPHAIFRYYQ